MRRRATATRRRHTLRRTTPQQTKTGRPKSSSNTSSSQSTRAAAPVPPTKASLPFREDSRPRLREAKVNLIRPLPPRPQSLPGRQEYRRSHSWVHFSPSKQVPRKRTSYLSWGAMRILSGLYPRARVLLTMLLCPDQTAIASGTFRMPKRTWTIGQKLLIHTSRSTAPRGWDSSGQSNWNGYCGETSTTR